MNDTTNKELDNLFHTNSGILIPQSTGIVNFSSYKKDKRKLFENISYLYKLLRNWNIESAFEFLNFSQKNNFEDILEYLSFLPNEKYLSNMVETLAIFFEANLITIGDILENEILFQSFKRIYSERVLIILQAFLYYIYSFEKKVLPVKKTAWELLSKSNKHFEAFFLLDEINKSNIRIKKIHELLTQERYNLNQKINENIDLLNCFLGSNNILTHIFNAYKNFDSDEYIVKYLTQKLNIDEKPRPLIQKILMYKTSDHGNNVINILKMWSSNINTDEFMNFLINNFSYILKEDDFYKIEYQDIFRDIHLSALDFCKKNNKNIVDMLLNLFVAYLFNYTNFLSFNDLKKVMFYFSFESVIGVNKIKYKIEDVIEGIIKSIIFTYKNIEIPSLKKHDFIELFHYLIQGFYSANIEIYPNITIIQKNIETLHKKFDNEIKNLLNKEIFR
ncbi:MAG: hypothetical protein KatS3mg068_1106 [Candidatus Sericytochromatia bacterium]|nr:MAG: hypothetical protein KatS3mg068_1106 [Candidatus Sericytochromatia bacterium]